MCPLRSDRWHSDNGTPAPTDAGKQWMRRLPRGTHPIRPLAVAPTDNGLLAPELAAGIARV